MLSRLKKNGTDPKFTLLNKMSAIREPKVETEVAQIYERRNEMMQVVYADDQIVLLRSAKERRVSGGNVHHIVRRQVFEKERKSGFYTLQPDSELDMTGDEPVDWAKVSYIGEKTTQRLHDAGYETALDVQKAQESDLLDVDGLGKAGVSNLQDFTQ